MVNNRSVDIPSYLVKLGDVVQVREKSRTIARIKESVETAKQRGIPGWVEVDAEHFQGKIIALPKREEITMPIKEQLIVELYSK
jgi:small subunit ribosomal protein S4